MGNHREVSTAHGDNMLLIFCTHKNSWKIKKYFVKASPVSWKLLEFLRPVVYVIII